jgi:hypothetical protein
MVLYQAVHEGLGPSSETNVEATFNGLGEAEL